MALGDTTLAAARGNTARGRQPYMVQTELDFAVALADKGSALAGTDVIPTIAVPAGTMILAAGAQVVTPTDATATTVDIGTGVDADVFVDGFDSKSAAGTYAQAPAAYQPVMAVADDNIDVTIASLTGTLAAGKLRVWAVLMDVTDVGDLLPNEVDRDVLA